MSSLANSSSWSHQVASNGSFAVIAMLFPRSKPVFNLQTLTPRQGPEKESAGQLCSDKEEVLKTGKELLAGEMNKYFGTRLMGCQLFA
jgi:hypothetical protein